MYELYSLRTNYFRKIPLTKEAKDKFLVHIFKPSFFQLCIPGFNHSLKSKIHSLYWYLITKGNFRIYYVSDGDILVHTSYCLPKCYKFPFMKKGDIHIGPCQTNSKYRGRGIYPYVISRIVQDFANANFYMIIDSTNISSQRGVFKVGFKRIVELNYHRILKIFKIVES